MWEVAEKHDGETLWRGRDWEGQRIWRLTRDRGGMPNEPYWPVGYYSRKAALLSRESTCALCGRRIPAGTVSVWCVKEGPLKGKRVCSRCAEHAENIENIGIGQA